MYKRPSNLIYSLDEKPPLGLTGSLSLQHLVIGLMYLVYPVLLMNEIGADVMETQRMLAVALLTIGTATILQALPKGPVGSGFLAIQVTNPIMLPLSLEAAHEGGIGLVFGMLIVMGFAQVFFARIFNRLRAVFPPEVCGVVIAMLGFSMIGISVKRFAGFDGTMESIVPQNIAIAMMTLTIMFGLTIFFRGLLRLFAIMIGIVIGYIVSYVCGLVPAANIAGFGQMPLLAIPEFSLPSYGFEWHLLLPFLITGLVSSIDTAGGIITCQKMNNDAWTRPDLPSLSGGVLADGIGNILAGISGGFGMGVSSANVGLAMASGATSRRIATVAGIMLILTAFLPGIPLLISMIPTPVMGAVLVYVSSFLIVSGFQLIMSRMLDDRRSALVGLSIVAGLSVEIVPDLYANVPAWGKSFFVSSLAIASITAIVLNLIFRLGISRKAELILDPQDDVRERLYRFIRNQGSGWGARNDIIQRSIMALTECMETITADIVSIPVKIQARFDEFNLDFTIEYKGPPMKFPTTRPSPEEVLESEQSLRDLSGYLARQYADKVSTTAKGDFSTITIHFDH